MVGVDEGWGSIIFVGFLKFLLNLNSTHSFHGLVVLFFAVFEKN